jgi:MFS family permease
MSSLLRVPPEACRAFRCDATSSILCGFYAGIVGPFLMVVARDQLHVSAFGISLMTAAPFVGNLATLWWARHMHSRRKLPYVVVISAVGRGLYVLMLWATHAPSYVAVATFAMMIEPMFLPAYATVMKDVYPDHCRGQLMGYVRAGVVVAHMIGALLAGRLMPEVGYRLLFPLGALLGVLSGLSFGHIGGAETPEPPAQKKSLLSTFDVLIEDHTFRRLMIGLAIFGCGSTLAAPMVPLLQVDVLHITSTWVGILATVAAGVSGLAGYMWGRLIDRHDPMVTLVCALTISVAYHVVFIFVQHVPTLLVASVCMGVGFAGADLSWFNWVLRFRPRDRIPQYSSLSYFIAGIRGMAIPFLSVALLQWLPPIALPAIRQVFVIAVLLNLVGLAFLLRTTKRARAEARLAQQS